MVRMQLTRCHLVRDRQAAKRFGDQVRVRDGVDVREGVREIAL